MGFQSVIFLTSFISSNLLRCPHHFILRAFIYLTSSPFINFCNSSLLPILHPSLQWTGPNISLKSVFQKLINYLRPVQTMSRFRMRKAQIYLGHTISRRHPSLGDIRFRQLVSFPFFLHLYPILQYYTQNKWKNKGQKTTLGKLELVDTEFQATWTRSALAVNTENGRDTRSLDSHTKRCRVPPS